LAKAEVVNLKEAEAEAEAEAEPDIVLRPELLEKAEPVPRLEPEVLAEQKEEVVIKIISQ
jgi:hypothetical protein